MNGKAGAEARWHGERGELAAVAKLNRKLARLAEKAERGEIPSERVAVVVQAANAQFRGIELYTRLKLMATKVLTQDDMQQLIDALIAAASLHIQDRGLLITVLGAWEEIMIGYDTSTETRRTYNGSGSVVEAEMGQGRLTSGSAADTGKVPWPD